MIQPNKHILDLAPYVGGDAGIKTSKPYFKLSSNEAALGASPHIVFDDDLALYPPSNTHALREKISITYSINKELISCGNGSGELIHYLCQGYLSPTNSIIYSEHGFLLYPIASKAMGAQIISVPETDYTADLSAMLAAIQGNTKIIFLANPNNPTGTYVSKTDLIAFLDKVPSHIMVVLDGAYDEFVNKDLDYTNGLELVETYPNLVVLKTFSKAYGLAALRLGWCHAHASIIDVVNRIRDPFNVNAHAQSAGIIALQDQEHLQKGINHNARWRSLLTDFLNDKGLNVIPSQGNFISFNCRDKTNEIYEYLVNNALYVRKLNSYKLPQHLRVSIGNDLAMTAFMKAMNNV